MTKMGNKFYSVLVLALASCASAPTNQSPVPVKPDELVDTEVLVIEQVAARSKRGGSSSSIGTDSYDVRTQTAWFYGDKPIVTCFNHIESFGISADEAARALESSLARWREYFKAKKIVRPGSNLGPNFNFQLKGQNKDQSTSKCTGGEDLAIFFGTGPIFGGLSDLKTVQRLYFPAAYVNKTHMTRDMKWAKGYIRLVATGYYGTADKADFPDWRKPGALEAVLTHELGHVLGFQHVPGTVMKAELVDDVFSTSQPAPLAEIDREKQLVSCEDCPYAYSLKDAKISNSFFSTLGLQGPVRLQKTGAKFLLSDGKTDRALIETSRTDLEAMPSLLSNFSEPINNSSRGYHLYGYVESPQKAKIPILLELNRSNTVVLRSTQDGLIREVGRFERE